MASIGDIKTRLALGRSQAEQGAAQIVAVAGQLDQTIGALQALVAGTGQPQVTQAIGKLGAAKQQLAQSHAAIRAAISDLDHYQAGL
jgi:hypothetical protein